MVSKAYYVYYRKHPSFREDKNLVKEEVVDGEKFALVAMVRAQSKDEIYKGMQGDFMPSKIKQMLEEARKRHGVKIHTSMSVGDCIQDHESEKVYQCADIGWELVKPRKVSAKSKPPARSKKTTTGKQPSNTQLVKKALQAAGYKDVSVTQGKGTARSWINVVVYGSKYDRKKDYGKVLGIAKRACGREHLEDDPITDLYMVKIGVDFVEKKPKPEKRVPQNTLKGTPEITFDKTESAGNYSRRMVKIQKGTYEYLFEHHVRKDGKGQYFIGLREGGRRYVMPKQFGTVKELCYGFPSLKDFLPKVFSDKGR